MGRSLTLNLIIAAGVFWVLMTVLTTGGLSVEGFKGTALQTLLFAMFYAVLRVGLILFKSGKE